MSTKKLEDFAAGKANQLTLSGTPPAQVMSNIRGLRDLSLLTDPVVWEMMAQTAVDPLYLIRILRKYKKELGLHEEEHHVGETLAFLAGDKIGERFYRVAYHVNIFTNDVTIMVRSPNDRDAYVQHSYIEARDLYRQLSDIPAGEQRLQQLLEILRQQITAALEYTQIGESSYTSVEDVTPSSSK